MVKQADPPTHSLTLDADQVLKGEGYRPPLYCLDESHLDEVTVVGGVAVTAEPLHPENGEWRNGGMREWGMG